jgi:hypothetical protein
MGISLGLANYMSMKSILMVSYYFPPEGSAGVYRGLRFLKELVKAGWEATVVCCEPYQYERYDPKLLSQVPADTRIVRVKAWDPWLAFQTWRGMRIENKLIGSSVEEVREVVAGHYAPFRSRLREIVRRAEAWVYRPDIRMPWIRPAVEQVQNVCRESRPSPPSVIWATIGPLSAGVVAYRASMATGIPYVLDFRDPWGLEYYEEEVRRPAWAKKADRNMMCRMFKRAQAVVFLFQSIANCYLQEFPEALDGKKIHIIPNGFEGSIDDFSHASDGRCKVLYTGTLSSYRYDTLLEGLLLLKKKDPERAKLLHLLFVGENLQEFDYKVVELGIKDIVEITTPVSYAEVRLLQQKAHALLILGRAPGRKGHELVAGAKLFGYLQARRPIIGILPSDETRRILGEVGVTTVADAECPSEVVTVFERILEGWSNRTLESLLPNHVVCEQYSSSRQISALLAALQGDQPERACDAGSTSRLKVCSLCL